MKDQKPELLRREPHVPDEWYVPAFYRDSEGHRQSKAALQDDAHTAYNLALLYRLTDNIACAKAVVRLIDAWSGLENMQRHDDSQLSFTYQFPAIIFAADMLLYANESL